MTQSFSIFTVQPFAPIQLQDSSPIMYNVNKMSNSEILTTELRSILEWRFRWRCRCPSGMTIPYFATMHASMNLCPRRISNLALISTTRCNKLRFKSKTLGGRSSKTSSTRCENAKKGKSINKQKKMALNAQHVRFTRFFSSAIFTEKRTSLWASVHPGNAAIKDKPEYFCEVIFSGNVLADVNVAFAYLSNLMLYQSKLI